MVKKPIISVVVQTRKTPLMILKRCIQCLREQTYSEVEIILLDSNEPDSEHKRAIQEEKDFLAGLIYLEIPEEGEFVEGKNTALLTFHGNYITFLSAQDTMPPTRLEEIITFYKNHPDYNAVCTDMSIQQDNILENSDVTLTIRQFTYLAQLVFHRDCFSLIGNFDSNLIAHCDDDIWLRLHSLHMIHHLSSPETTVSVCTSCYHNYTALDSAIGYRQFSVKYHHLYQKNKPARKELYQKIAIEYKKANLIHRYIQFRAKAFF